jgi:hypothetical protein
MPDSHDAPSGSLVPDYQARGLVRRPLLIPTITLALCIGVLCALYWVNTRQRPTRGVLVPEARSPVAVHQTEPPGVVSEQRQREVLDIYFAQVVPRLDESLRRKRDASDRAIGQLRARLDGHRHGARQFADDVTSWGTRFGLLGRMSKDAWRKWWKDDPNSARARAYVQAKFRAHVISERDLEASLEAAIGQFASDMEADRNALFADIRLPLQTAGAQLRVSDQRWEELQKQIMTRGGAIAEAGARDTLVTGLTSETVSGVAGWAAQRVVVQVLARVGPAVAAQVAASGAAAAGGAMAGGVGSGGAAGSIGGPAGTVIGIGAGLVVGAAIDWWMTDRFKDKLIEQCNRFIDTVRDSLIDGAGGQPGLRSVFDDAVRLSDEAQRKAILEVLLREVGGDSKK